MSSMKLKTVTWRLPVDPEPSKILIELAAIGRILNMGGIIVFPTDTVYGIGCDPYRQDSVQGVVTVKGRSSSKGMPILASNIQAAAQIVEFNTMSRQFAQRVWPGDVTLILPVLKTILKRLPELVTGGRDTVAIRVPGLPLTRLITEKNSGLLIGTSANFTGEPPITDPKELLMAFNGLVDGIILGVRTEGEAIVGSGVASTIIDLTSEEPKVLRGGLREPLKGDS